MKHLIFVCLIALISCSSDDPQPVKQSSFDSIVGEWTFKGDDVSGTVFIAEFFDEIVVDNVGTFTVKGVQYTILDKSKVNFGTVPGTLQSIFLLHDDETYFGLHGGSINSSFTEIVFKEHSYGTKTTFVIGDKITLKRK